MRRLAIIVLLSLASCPAWASWAETNHGSAVSSPAVASIASSAFSSALTNNSLIVVGCLSAASYNWQGGSSIYSVPTDTAGNTYKDVQVGITAFNNSTASLQLFYAINTHTTASNVVTCHASASNTYTFFTVVAAEFTGGSTNNSPIDWKMYAANQTSGAAGVNSLVAPSGNTTINGDLVVAMFAPNGGPLTAGTSPNAFTQISTTGGMFEYFVQTTAGAIAPTAGDSTASDPWGAIWVAFAPAGTAALATDNYRNDPCATADNTTLAHNWVMRHCQGETSDGIIASTSSMVLTTNPVVGDKLIAANGDAENPVLLVTSDSLGNVARGKVNTSGTAVTFVSGDLFGQQGCSSTCLWNGDTINIGGTNYTIGTVNSITSITLTTSAGTQSGAAYIGPAWSCSDTAAGTPGEISACQATVTTSGVDKVTVTCTGAGCTTGWSLSTAVSDIGLNGFTILGQDASACATTNCIPTTSISNASTGIIAQSLTLSTTNELVFFMDNVSAGQVFTTSGWDGMVIGNSSASSGHTNTYCGLVINSNQPFCTNETQSVLEVSSSSGSFSANNTDATKSDDAIMQSIVLEQGAAIPTNTVPVIY